MGVVLWESSCGGRLAGVILWGVFLRESSCGGRIVGVILWGSSCAGHPMGVVLWESCRGSFCSHSVFDLTGRTLTGARLSQTGKVEITLRQLDHSYDAELQVCLDPSPY